MNERENNATADRETAPGMRASTRPSPALRRMLPLVLVAIAFAGFFAADLDHYFTFEALRDNRDLLTGLVAAHPAAAVVAFMLVYALSTALSLPGGVVLTVTGGFLFGAWAATLYVTVAATMGAVAVFLLARTTLGDALRARAGGALSRMEAGFCANAFSYLLVLRLIPLFPFFVVNVVPAFLGVSLRTYTLGTVIGIIPGCFVFASVGAGLGSVFDQGDGFDPSSALTPQVITALVGLAVLSLLPVAYKRFVARRG